MDTNDEYPLKITKFNKNNEKKFSLFLALRIN